MDSPSTVSGPLESGTINIVTPGWMMSLRQKLPTSISTPSSVPSHSYRDIGEGRRRAPRILVVDDNKDIMLLMQELLATRGYDVVAVPDAVRPEIKILRCPPDTILSAVVIPGNLRYELCVRLQP